VCNQSSVQWASGVYMGVKRSEREAPSFRMPGAMYNSTRFKRCVLEEPMSYTVKWRQRC